MTDGNENEPRSQVKLTAADLAELLRAPEDNEAPAPGVDEGAPHPDFILVRWTQCRSTTHMTPPMESGAMRKALFQIRNELPASAEEVAAARHAAFLQKANVYCFPRLCEKDFHYVWQFIAPVALEALDVFTARQPDLLEYHDGAADAPAAKLSTSSPERLTRTSASPKPSSPPNGTPRSLAEAKKILTIPIIWTALGLSGTPQKLCPAPYRRDRNPSFSVYQTEAGEWRFNDFARPGVCGEGFAFFKLCKGLESAEAVRPFRELAAEVAAGGVPASTPAVSEERDRSKKSLSKVSSAEIARMPKLLLEQSECIARIAKKRGWKAATITMLATEGSLGWFQGKAAFIFDTGVKLRWIERGKRRFEWCGRPSIWRRRILQIAEKIYLCEGETDVITLIDAGMESVPASGVVSIPSASTFSPSWAPLFAGKEVVLCFDNDAAGNQAANKIGRLLAPHVKVLNRLNLTEAFK